MISKIKTTNFKDELAAEVTADYERRREERKPLELQWRLNMNFVNGNQYAEISPAGDIEEYGKRYFWQEREVYNHIASIVETRLSKLARVRSGVSVRPFSNDDADIHTAKLSTQIVKALCEENNLSGLFNTATSWSEATGTCFFKTTWDADRGRFLGETGGKGVREGDVNVSVVPPFEIFPDSVCAKDIEDCASIIHAKAYKVSEVKDIWGIDVTGGDVDVFSLDNSSIAGGMGYSASVSNMISTTLPDSCIVIERYEKPTKELPDGRLVTVAGGKLVYAGELPYSNGVDGQRTFPFTRILALERVGCFFGTSIIERLIPLQRSYNAVKNRKHEFMNRVAMGVLAVEDGSIDTDNLEEEGLCPGKVLVYRQGAAPPRLLDPGKVPSEFIYEEEKILSEFITISGVSELSKYSQTYSSMSGRAISLLVEQDDTRLSIASSSIRLGMKHICEQMLRLYKQFADNRRLKRVSGENGEVELRYFNASDLQSEDLTFDNDNDLTDTLANRRNMVLELVKMGIMYDENGRLSERNKLKILELLGLGNWEDARDSDECHRKKAIKENICAASENPVVDEYDDHDIHIEEHINALVGGTDKDEKALERLREHIRTHEMLKNMKAQSATLEQAEEEER